MFGVLSEIAAVSRLADMGAVRNQSALRQLRHSNVARVLGLLRIQGPQSRAEVAALTGLSRTTLSGIIGRLVADGVLVEEAESRPATGGGRGRPVQRLTLNPRSAQAVGVEIGRERIRVVIADAAHEIKSVGGTSSSARADARTRARAAARAVREAAERDGIDLRAVTGLGVGTPGPGETADHTTEHGRGSGQARTVPPTRQRVVDELAGQLDVPVLADNNSRLAALGEAIWGAARGAQDVLYVALSQGVGGGLVVGGRLFRGAFGAAGEVGHISVDPDGPDCWCGGRGCMERYASVPAVLRACRRRSWERLRAAVESGEEHACGVVTGVATSVGRALAAACTTVNPERIVLGGEVAGLGPVFLDAVQAAFETYSTSLVHRGIRLTPAALDDRSGAMGGLALVLQESPLLAGYTEPMSAAGGGHGTAGADDASNPGAADHPLCTETG